MNKYHYALFILLGASSCTCNKPTLTPGSPEVKEQVKNEPVKSPEWQAIETDLKAYFDSQEKGDFETFGNYSMPRLFELAPREETLAGLKSFYDQGLRQGMDDLVVTSISEAVDDSLTQIRLVKFTGKMWIKFLPEYPSSPKALYNQIKEEHGEQFIKFDEEAREYIIEKEFKIYAISPKVYSSNFTFLNHGFIRSSMANEIMSYETLRTLKSYE